ncbi:MAG TPA: purine-nucleoside phosphorylase, partial [Geopsychrobacteraceae bacterium]|nr:purine-nucleoside phosphorylase [Geopsychrobacteraceae bacterium]
MKLLGEVRPAAEVLKQLLGPWQPETALVLGSGLASLTDSLTEARSLAFEELPDFPPAGVSGHSGRIWFGRLYDRPVIIFQGRYHYYEGYSAYQVAAPVRLAKELGCSKILLTNAAGGIASDFYPGHFMLVTDHLNLVSDNPLRALSPPSFIDLCSLYRHDFYPELKRLLGDAGVVLHQGSLAWMCGPSYETPAEIRMLEMFGADAVAMSTIPEALMAISMKLETVAISLIANAAAGKNSDPLR